MLENQKEIVVKAADKKLAFDMKLIDVSQLSGLTDYFFICSGNTERQANAIADEIDQQMSVAGIKPNAIEGYRQGNWILMDYGNIIVHVFKKETREYYNLDGLWKDAAQSDIEEYLK